MTRIKKIPVKQMNRSWLMAFFFLAGLAIIAGCSAPSGTDNASEHETSVPVTLAASWRATINQPDALSGSVKMDTDIYNIGEVVEFTVTNEGGGTLQCAGDPPTFSVKTQNPGGAWITKMGDGQPNRTVSSSLGAGESTRKYAFVTTGWEPGRYRIVHDCGVEREFLLKVVPAVTMAPEVCPETTVSNATPWIAIDNITNPVAYEPFTIRGTTNLPVGQELVYTIFAVQDGNVSPSLDNEGTFRTTVVEGSCGTNTWAATGEIQVSGEFAIGIMGTNKTPSAIRRFSVLPE